MHPPRRAGKPRPSSSGQAGVDFRVPRRMMRTAEAPALHFRATPDPLLFGVPPSLLGDSSLGSERVDMTVMTIFKREHVFALSIAAVRHVRTWS